VDATSVYGKSQKWNCAYCFTFMSIPSAKNMAAESPEVASEAERLDVEGEPASNCLRILSKDGTGSVVRNKRKTKLPQTHHLTRSGRIHSEVPHLRPLDFGQDEPRSPPPH
jgi:hypothetical protein